ncbi:45577_t:CDS:1, partial [Gigaspora margarita]
RLSKEYLEIPMLKLIIDQNIRSRVKMVIRFLLESIIVAYLRQD